MDDAKLELDLEDLTREPEVSPEAARHFEEAALIGGEKLRSSGFFVNIVKKAAPVEPRAQAPLVLVVEDDIGTARVIEAVLKKQGFGTRTAANLRELTRALRLEPGPDAVLLDILLPDVNGFAVLERLRRHPDLAEVPVVMLTSLSEAADVAKGLALGANGYLSKPARPQALVSALRDVLGLTAP